MALGALGIYYNLTYNRNEERFDVSYEIYFKYVPDVALNCGIKMMSATGSLGRSRASLVIVEYRPLRCYLLAFILFSVFGTMTMFILVKSSSDSNVPAKIDDVTTFASSKVSSVIQYFYPEVTLQLEMKKL